MHLTGQIEILSNYKGNTSESFWKGLKIGSIVNLSYHNKMIQADCNYIDFKSSVDVFEEHLKNIEFKDR